jgi:hypothetical protein
MRAAGAWLVPEERIESDIAATPDVVIRLDGATHPLDRWPAPALGTWTLEHGVDLPSGYRPEPLGLAPGCPEMLLGRVVTISRLVATTGDEKRVLGQIVSRVDRVSLRRGSRGHISKLAGLVSRTLSAVRRDGSLPDSIAGLPSVTPARGATRLGTAKIAVGLARIPVGYVHRLIRRKAFPERWVVVISRPHHDPRRVAARPLQYLDAPRGREWADPFPLHTPDGDLLFIEEYVRATHRGRLAVVELDDSPRGWRSVETILDLPAHLSYPFIFQWSGSWYLLPEQAATNGLQLYVAEAFPTTWRWHSTSLDVPASDATVAEIDGRWWLFTAIAPVDGTAADELHLFHAATPLGPWTAHARNPVVSDVRSARPAGRLFRRDGAWYRVAQNGAISYGHSIVIVRIDRIDLDGYRESVVDEIRPDWAPRLIATHTLNSDDDITAMDVLRIEPRLRFRSPP